MALEVTVGRWHQQTIVPRSPLGLSTTTNYVPLAPRMTAHTLAAQWTKITATIPQGTRPAGSTLNLLLTAAPGDVFPAGSVWVDDVSVVCVGNCSAVRRQHPTAVAL